jgi:hypothetical protein
MNQNNRIFQHSSELPRPNQVYEYAARVGVENMEPQYKSLYNLYVQVDANNNHVCIRGDDFAVGALGFMIGCAVGYLFYRVFKHGKG